VNLSIYSSQNDVRDGRIQISKTNSFDFYLHFGSKKIK
jgi:hypothetical protein